MKTAMKKLFSLMLVAVLLVGVMPFQAFAAEPVIVNVELEPGEYTVNDDFITNHYTGSGTPLKYYVHNYAYQDGSFTIHETTTVMLVIEEFAAPVVCDNCSGSHKTEDCTKIHCTVCNAWTDHDASAHAPTTATVTVVINNAGTGKSFSIEAGKNANDVYAAFLASSLAAQYEGAHGPIVTLEDGVTVMTTAEAGKTYYLWLTQDTSTPPADEPADEPVDNTCTDCQVNPCICCDECDGTINAHKPGCPLNTPADTTDKVKVYLHPNYDYPYKKGETIPFVWAERNALLSDVVATIPAPTRDKHMFQHWTTDANGTDVINQYCDARATGDGVMIYAQWADIVQSTNGDITLRINLNYSDKMGEAVRNIVFGARMGDVLEYVETPLRWNYKFVGWYWDSNCTTPVKASDRLYVNAEIFAKWERRETNNEIMLKIYLNGDTQTVAQVVDIYNCAKDDGWISLAEVKKVVKQYYTGKTSDGLYFEGLYDSSDWGVYVDNNNYTGSATIKANMSTTDASNTIVYVMVHNAKLGSSGSSSSSSSSGTPDSSNPKTGDMIMTPVIVLGASATCLAVLFYLNKKRAY